MRRHPAFWLLGVAALVVSACSATAESTEPPADGGQTAADDGPAADPTGAAAPTSSTTSTTSTTAPPLDVYDPDCVVQVARGESLSLIADRFDDDTVYPATIIAENELGDEVIHPGQLLDVCVDNGLDDVTGAQRFERNQALVAVETREAVRRQQEQLNVLFDGTGIPPLTIDGVSGPITRQRLCAARVALGLPVSTDDMAPDSDEERELLAADTLPVPFTSAILSEKWILIDLTCQIMFVGEGAEEIVYVFPTSTGEPGHETRPQDRTRVYRFDPALDNGGWHNSSTFPVEEDNPLNGNMYKPLYFDGGQAIHGANNVPTSPQSKGCARLRTDHQNLLIEWMGLDDVSDATYSHPGLDVTVNVQGAYDHGDDPPATDDPATTDAPPADDPETGEPQTTDPSATDEPTDSAAPVTDAPDA